jgi:hypothetical protein
LNEAIAAIGSAVGLGNMWQFSYMTDENGGAAFVVLYLAMTLFVGLPVMLTELTVGRSSRRSPIRALVYFGGPAGKPLGALLLSLRVGWGRRDAVAEVSVGAEEIRGLIFARPVRSARLSGISPRVRRARSYSIRPERRA